MSNVIKANRTDTNVPLVLVVSDQNGGVTGLTVKVAIREGTTNDSYLDHSGATFKTTGWALQFKSMQEIAGVRGVYGLSGGLDINAMSGLDATARQIIAEYTVSGTVKGVSMDMIELTEQNVDDIFNRDMDQVEVAAPVHSLATAILKLVSRVKINGASFEIYRTDGSTLKATQVRSTAAGTPPTTELAASV